ncbi:hypothetical protein BHE74_00051935 [Ensete ventricosum]|nr:hypothetical protein BHE74_00051935 [Ensete ventricosum]
MLRTHREIVGSSLKVSEACREFAGSSPKVLEACREFVESLPKVIESLSRVRRELVEGDRELIVNATGVRQKMTKRLPGRLLGRSPGVWKVT